MRWERASVAALVSEAVAGVIGADVAPDQPLMAAGLDSLGAVELRNALERKLAVALPPTLVFDYPSMEALSGYLVCCVGVSSGFHCFSGFW
jgi:acyl carrier protein